MMRDRASTKKKILIAAAVLAAAGVVAGLILLLTDNDKPRSPYPDAGYAAKDFVLVDDDAPDIFEDDAYLELDRTLYLQIGGEEIAIPDKTSEDADEAALFFLDYFDAIANGDSERYNSMFSDEYYESFLPQEDFTQQMVYDMHISRISYAEDGAQLEMVYYVDYKIRRNNGTFRTDILSDATRKLCFTLSGTAGDIKIDSIAY